MGFNILGGSNKKSKTYETTDSYNKDSEGQLTSQSGDILGIGTEGTYDATAGNKANTSAYKSTVTVNDISAPIISRTLESLDSANSLASDNVGELIGSAKAMQEYNANILKEFNDTQADLTKSQLDSVQLARQQVSDFAKNMGTTMQNAINSFNDNARTAMTTVTNAIANRTPLAPETIKQILIASGGLGLAYFAYKAYVKK